MFELTINDKVYKFKFGMGFLRELNKKVNMPMQGVPEIKKNIGFQYYLSGLIDGSLEDLVEILYCANQGYSPRITKDTLDNFIDNEETDIDELIENVMGFLKKANATKKTTIAMLDEVEKAKAEA